MGLLDAYPDTYLPRDPLGALVGIDIVHREIHLGNHYTCGTYESIGAGSTLSMLITAPATATAIIHLTASLFADGAGVMTFSEAPNASAGTALVAYNNDRTSDNTTSVVATKDPTYASSGTTMVSTHIGTLAPSINLGGETEGRHEWKLADSTLYLIRFTADGTSCRTAITATWYEE